MLDTIRSFVDTLTLNVRAADVIDVLLISALLYALLAWMRHRVSRVVGFGIASVALVYALAHVLDLYLTSMVFQVGLTVIALAMVVVFQDDIRRLFERLRTLSLGEARSAKVPSAALDTLVDAVGQLAARRIGALIVLPGREGVEVHLHGGVGADAALSVPLLMSIFHPKTAGHDGAVVVRDGRMERFAVHLPLSTHLGKLGRGGTRHAAALGLAERCDAFVIVVSEERGTVSVAREGQLIQLDAAAELRPLVEQFENAAPPVQRQRRWPRWVAHNLRLKLAAVGMASMLWLLFAYRVETVQRTYEVPIEYRGLPSNWYLQDPKPISARVELSGSERAFDDVKPSQLKISVDLNHVQEGAQQVALTASEINVPTGVNVSDFEPHALRLKAHRLVKTQLPVRAHLQGNVAPGFKLDKIVTEPGRVEVQIPQYMQGYVNELPTEAINVNGLHQSTNVSTRLVASDQIRFAGKQPPKIKIHLEISKKAPTQTLPAMSGPGS